MRIYISVSFQAACAYDASLDPHHLEGYIALAHAPSLEGPWTKLPWEVLSSGSANGWDASVTNPAPLFLANGTALLFYRGTHWPVDGLERIGLAVSSAGWRGAYGRLGDGKPLWGDGTDADDPRG